MNMTHWDWLIIVVPLVAILIVGWRTRGYAKSVADFMAAGRCAGRYLVCNAYGEADNGNKSSVHWDLVCLQDDAHGGGEIYFDDQLVRRNGLFVVPELEPLNPENLK